MLAVIAAIVFLGALAPVLWPSPGFRVARPPGAWVLAALLSLGWLVLAATLVADWIRASRRPRRPGGDHRVR